MSETVNPTVGARAPSYAMEGEEFEDAKDTSAPELRGSRRRQCPPTNTAPTLSTARRMTLNQTRSSR